MGKRSRRTGNREERNLVAYPFTAGVVCIMRAGVQLVETWGPVVCAYR